VALELGHRLAAVGDAAGLTRAEQKQVIRDAIFRDTTAKPLPAPSKTPILDDLEAADRDVEAMIGSMSNVTPTPYATASMTPGDNEMLVQVLPTGCGPLLCKCGLVCAPPDDSVYTCACGCRWAREREPSMPGSDIWWTASKPAPADARPLPDVRVAPAATGYAIITDAEPVLTPIGEMRKREGAQPSAVASAPAARPRLTIFCQSDED
jgi:hypothetical protein